MNIFRNPVLSVGTSNEVQKTNNNGGFDSTIITENGSEVGINGINTDSILALNSIGNKGLLPPRSINPSAITTAPPTLQVHNLITDRLEYNHTFDSWIPVGRYAGNFLTGAGAVNNQQIQGVNLSGELIGLRVGLDSSSNIIPLNPSGVPFTNGSSLGTSSTTWASVYSSNFYAGNSSTYARYFFGSTGSMGALLGNSGTDNGGIRLTANTGSICFFKFCNASTVNKQGLIVSEAKNGLSNLGVNSEIEPTAILELQGKTKGFLPPRMTTVEMNAISVTASSTGLMIYDETTNQWMGYNGTSWVILG